ncbi:hypothetical protein Tco_0720089 [Tanacetum coccineum]
MSSYLVNKSLSSTIGFKMPIDVIGYFCWLACIKQWILEPRKVKCIFLGYHEDMIGYQLWSLDNVTSKIVLYKNMGFNESGEYKETFIAYGVCTSSVHVLRACEFEVEPLGDHTFGVEPQGNELFMYREDGNETIFAVAGAEKIYAHESLTFNDIVAYEVISKWKARLNKEMDVRSDVYVLNNNCMISIDDKNGYYWEYAPVFQREVGTYFVRGTLYIVVGGSLSRDYDVEKKRSKWSYISTVRSQKYQVVCIRPDIVSADMGMLDGFDRGLQTDVYVFVDFDYTMGRSINVTSRLIIGYVLMIRECVWSLEAMLHHSVALSRTKAGYMAFTKAWKTYRWLKGLTKEPGGYELRLVAGIATSSFKKAVQGRPHVDHLTSRQGGKMASPHGLIRDSFNISLRAWYLDDGTIIGDTLIVGEVLKVIMENGPCRGLHLNVDKTGVFFAKGGSEKQLMDVVAKINDPQCELLLVRACAGISKLYFAMRTCPPRVFQRAQCSFNAALRSALVRIVTASGLGFGDRQLILSTLPFAFGGLGVYSASDVLNYAFLAPRLQSAGLQTKLFRHSDIVTSGSAFYNAFSTFNVKIEINLLGNSSEVAASKLMKKLVDIYFIRVTQTTESTFSLSTRQMALWKSQMEDHRSDCLKVVPNSGRAQLARFATNIYGDHVVSCAGIFIVRDTLVNICFRSGISAGKEVDIGLGGGREKPLHPAHMLLYSWDLGLDVCVDLTSSSPLTQTRMLDFAPGRAVTEAAQRKRVKYEAKCTNIRYGFLLFSFSSFGELENDAVTLLKRIRRFPVTQDIGARAAIYIFNRIGFAIARGVWAQIVSSH